MTKSDPKKLEPCPFCNSKDLTAGIVGEDGQIGIWCNCGCCVHVEPEDCPDLTDEEREDGTFSPLLENIKPLRNKWNQRHTKTTPPAQGRMIVYDDDPIKNLENQLNIKLYTAKEAMETFGNNAKTTPSVENDIDVYVVKRRGNIYGFFVNYECAKKYGEMKSLEDRDTRFQDCKGMVHKIKLSEAIHDFLNKKEG